MRKIAYGMTAVMISMMITFTVQAAVINLGDPLSPTQAAGTWYTDRYAPSGFSYSGGVLTETISSADQTSKRGASYSGAFYNTQGRKHDLGVGVTSMSIELFVNSSWATNPGAERTAGFWGTAVDGSNAISGYPILEFTNDGLASGGPRFQGWDDTAGWDDYGLPVAFQYDAWHVLKIGLNGSNWDYLLDGTLLGSVAALGSIGIDNAILQGYNNYTGANSPDSYDIKWRNFETNPQNSVPEPSTAALFALAFGGLWFARRKPIGKAPG
jgi:hypothetical protein